MRSVPRSRAAFALRGAFLVLAAAGCSSNGATASTGAAPTGAATLGTTAATPGRPPPPSPTTAAPPPRPGNGPLRPGDLLASPQSYLNQTVDVVIVEPLRGPPTLAALAAATYGQVSIESPDGLGVDFALVPATFKPDDPNRYMQKFDRVIVAPVRVRGEFLGDDDLAKQSRKPAYVIRVASVEAIPPEAPVKVGSLADLKADPARWDRKRIVYEGVFETGFEVSTLDREIWLRCETGCESTGEPAPREHGRSVSRVRATGVLYAKPGARYGHMGAAGFQLNASKLDYLGPAPGK